MDQGTLFEIPPDGDPGSVALAELLETYELVEANDDVIIMAERTQLAEPSIPLGEIGYSSPSPWTAWTREEWNPKLRDKLGITEYYRMKRLDGIIRGALRVFKTPVLSAHWFMKPGSDSTRDKNVAQWVQDNLSERMSTSCHVRSRTSSSSVSTATCRWRGSGSWSLTARSASGN